MQSSMPVTHIPEHEFNFKVKVNYQNGAVSVHGPPAFLPVHAPVQASHPLPQIYMHQQVKPHAVHPDHFTQHYARNNTQGSICNAVPVMGLPSFGAPLPGNRLDRESSVVFSDKHSHTTGTNPRSIPEDENNLQINCVVCEKNFKPNEFDLHLELHRKGVRKPTSSSIHNANPEANREIISSPSLQQQSFNERSSLPSNSLIRPELLYSFNDNNHDRESLASRASQSKASSSSRSLNKVIVAQHPQQIIPHNMSFGSSARSSQQMQSHHDSIRINSGIRYLSNPFVASTPLHNSSLISQSNHSSMHQAIPAVHNYGPAIVESNPQVLHEQSFMSSKVSSSQQSQGMRQEGTFKLLQTANNSRVSSQNRQPQAVNPFAILQQDQSKIYQYFPDSENYSLSQHRVRTEGNSGNFLSFRETVKYPTRKPRIGQLDDARSECSRSSVSSACQNKQPLEAMSKETLLRSYHSKKNKINLSNIIGLSQKMAIHSVDPNSKLEFSKHHLASSQKIRNTLPSHKLKKMTPSNSIYNSQLLSDEQTYKTLHINQNPGTIAVQGRQIFRGTQVDQQQLQHYDSQLNLTRSSKSSAKTKIPKNYLAVDEFISSMSASQHRNGAAI